MPGNERCVSDILDIPLNAIDRLASSNLVSFSPVEITSQLKIDLQPFKGGGWRGLISPRLLD